jgi:phosphoribosyl 1,2-cyclic phosphodiesterase
MMWFCSLYSGSSGNCLYVGSEKANILIDAGLSGKRIANSLDEIGISPRDIDALLITHEHSDHIKGAGILSRMFNIPIYANNNTWESMKGMIGNIKEENIRVIDTGDPFEIGDIVVKSYSTPHDAAESVGYSFIHGKKKVCIATDIGHVSGTVFENVRDSDLILLESNHDVEMLKFGPYPYVLKRRILSNIGHLSNDDAGKAIPEMLGNKRLTVVLGHLSQQNNYPELAYQTVMTVLKECGVDVRKDITLDLAHRDRTGTFFDI